METERQLRMRNWIIGAAVVLFVVAALVVFMLRKGTGGVEEPDAPAAGEFVSQSEAAADVPAAREASPQTPAEQARADWAERFGTPPEWPRDLSAPRDCEIVARDLQSLCAYIDARPGVRALAEGYGICDLLREAAGELARRPPRISSELRSYETMLSNVFHLSRVLGRERMRLPAKLLAEHQELAEPLALALYRWMVSRESCEKKTALTGDVLYDYAGFLFNTMGGQAYLRRRTPLVEGLTCFYALQMVDSAQQRGHNPAGLDPRHEIVRCRALLAAQPFVFTPEYLANLEDMALRWESD